VIARLWQPDKRTRLRQVAALVDGDGARVLDVGGRGAELAAVLRGHTVTSANVEAPCDVLVPARGPLPFPDAAFDVVTSTDVLEHVPAPDRAAHVAELVRVAARQVVMCFPPGTQEKSAAERRLQQRLSELGRRFDFLDEHVARGLPQVGDVVAAALAAAPEATVDVRYHEGRSAGDALLLDAVAALRLRPGPAWRVARAWVRPWQRPLVPTSGPDVHRAFVTVRLRGR
jgi:hypothetical protein